MPNDINSELPDADSHSIASDDVTTKRGGRASVASDNDAAPGAGAARNKGRVRNATRTANESLDRLEETRRKLESELRADLHQASSIGQITDEEEEAATSTRHPDLDPVQTQETSQHESIPNTSSEPFRYESSTSPAGQSGPASEVGDGFDNHLVQETRLQIRKLVQEIAQLSQSECEPDEFFEGFVSRLCSALASVGAAIWMSDPDGQLELTFASSLPPLVQTGNEARRHSLLLQRLLTTGEATLIPPASGSDELDAPGNPTPNLLVIAPVRVDREVVGLVEIFQRAGTGPTTQRGYLRFLTQMCDLAGDYFKTRQLRGFQNQQELFGKLDQFVRAIHGSLDQKETSYQLANEGRRVLDCDRLSIAISRNGSLSIQAVSGLDSLDRRAADLKLLTRLTQVVMRTEEPLWYRGNASDLPPQIEKRLNPYVDRTHCKLLGIIPLIHQTSDEEQDDRKRRKDRREGEIYGALIIEQLGSLQHAERLRSNANVIANHASDALANVSEYNRVPMIWLWRTLSRLSWFTQLRNLPLSVGITAIIVAITVGLCVVPANFELASDGSMTPVKRHDIFAPMDGTVRELFLPDNPRALIKQNERLLELENRELEVELSDLEGQEQRLLARRESIHRSLVEQNAELSVIDEIRLESEAAEVDQSLITINRQMEIKRDQLRELLILNPALGQVGDWQAKARLEHRRVQRGQTLLTLVDPTGEWKLELEVPEKHIGHLLSSQDQHEEPLTVTFILASDPSSQFEGRIRMIQPMAEVREGDQNIVLVEVSFDKKQLPEELLRHGTRVRARIDCGKRSIGYVLFHDVIETVQSRVLFWL